ncbi:MAG TPA: hypothetical protein VK177_18715 [Flavobacteriales bacterium]|nr:hypothetical protein [Flavobacteriales bacterium]
MNQKQINQYKWMRFGYLIASMLIIPIALYYCKSKEIEFMTTFGFIGALYCMGFILFFRQYIYPPDLRGAFSISLGLVVNFFFVFFLTDEGFVYSCYYLFFSFLCLQAIVVIGVAIITLLQKKTNLELLNRKKMSGKDYWFMGLTILAIGSPLLVAPYLLGKPFMDMMNSLEGSDYWLMWTGFIMDLAQQLFIIYRIVFAKGYQKEINEKQSKLMKDWEPIVNMMFFLGLMGIFVVMFL